jgi:hypothetical protein
MSRWISFWALLLTAASAGPQNLIDPSSTMTIDLPGDSPVRLVNASWGETTASMRGGLMQLYLRTTMTLQNVSGREIRGVMLRILAHEVTPGGKGSVAVPNVAYGPNEQFVVRVDLRLLRPLPKAGSPLVEVKLDGVLFENLEFWGDDQMRSRRSLTGWELQARRDRQRFQRVLTTRGAGALQDAMVASLARLDGMGDGTARVTRLTRAVARLPESEVRVAALDTPESPVEVVEGLVKVAGPELRYPQIALRNRDRRAVDSVEIGLRLMDGGGQWYLSGLSPLPVRLAANQTRSIQTPVFLEFAGAKGKLEIRQVEAFVNQVEFADGSVWIPGERALSRTDVQRRYAPSPEELRLADLYRRKGLDAVIEELKRFE